MNIFVKGWYALMMRWMSYANSLIHEYTVSHSLIHKQAHTPIACSPQYTNWQGLNTVLNYCTFDLDYMLTCFQCLDSTNVELFVWLCKCISVEWSTVVCYPFKGMFRPSSFENSTFCCLQICSISLAIKCVYILSVSFLSFHCKLSYLVLDIVNTKLFSVQ